MTQLLKKTKCLRKTFTIPNYIVKELEDFAEEHHQKQSQIVALALEEYLHKLDKSEKVKRRLEALDALVGIAPKGSLSDIDLKNMRMKRAIKDAH